MPHFPLGTYAALLNASGKTLQAIPFTYGGTSTSRPRLSVALVRAAAAHDGQTFATVGSTSGGSLGYRVLTWQPSSAGSGQPGSGTAQTALTVVVAIPLADVSGTLSSSSTGDRGRGPGRRRDGPAGSPRRGCSHVPSRR